VQFEAGTPKYLQVADEMRREIGDGELKIGDSVGDLFTLQNKYGCSWGTVRAGEQVLVREGLLSEIRMGLPTVVIATPGQLPLEPLLKRLRDNHRDLGEIIAGLEKLHRPDHQPGPAARRNPE
jgi:DNA-binding GntR family transcriptional regulator